MFLQSLMKYHQCFFKILRKQNVTDTLSFVRSDVKTVYTPTNTVCGVYKQHKSSSNNGVLNSRKNCTIHVLLHGPIHVMFFCLRARISHSDKNSPKEIYQDRPVMSCTLLR